jgi:hypothetical protein
MSPNGASGLIKKANNLQATWHAPLFAAFDMLVTCLRKSPQLKPKFSPKFEAREQSRSVPRQKISTLGGNHIYRGRCIFCREWTRLKLLFANNLSFDPILNRL